MLPEDFPPTLRRTDIDGVKVVGDVVMASPLAKHTGTFIPVKGIRILTLDDGSTRYACADCVFVSAPDREDQAQTPLGQVRAHRGEKHGVAMGGARRGRKAAVEEPIPGEPTDSVVLPRDTLSMSLLEILNLAGHIDQWSTVLAGLEEANERLVAERDEARASERAALKKYDDIKKVMQRQQAATQRKVAKALGLAIVTTEDKESE